MSEMAGTRWEVRDKGAIKRDLVSPTQALNLQCSSPEMQERNHQYHKNGKVCLSYGKAGQYRSEGARSNGKQGNMEKWKVMARTSKT